MKKARKIPPTLVVFFLTTVGICHAQLDSPVDVVRLFSTCYGGPRMDKTANYTTEHFRGNRPKSVWIVDTWKTLQQMKYERLHTCVIDSKVNDNKAAVIVDATIGTAVGETRQKEVYFLIKDGHKWLIDQLQVTDEDLDVNVEEMNL